MEAVRALDVIRAAEDALAAGRTDEGFLSDLGGTVTLFTGLDDLSGVGSVRLVYTLRDATFIRLGGSSGSAAIERSTGSCRFMA